MAYSATAVTNGNGDRVYFMGLDLGNLKAECVLGEESPVMKEIKLDKKVYEVGDLLKSDFGLKYDLILRMMLEDGCIDYDTKIKVGSEGRLKEVYRMDTKESYRIFGRTYYGKMKL